MQEKRTHLFISLILFVKNLCALWEGSHPFQRKLHSKWSQVDVFLFVVSLNNYNKYCANKSYRKHLCLSFPLGLHNHIGISSLTVDESITPWIFFLLLFIYLLLLLLLLLLFVVNFVIHWNETAMGLHVFPIPIPPPTSLSTRSL